MTDEQREKKAAALREAAKKRSDAIEQAQVAEIRSVWDHINPDTRRIFEYIEQEIPKRTNSDDVAYLRETRAIWFRPYRKHLKSTKEDASA
jgi:hypothetical protein